MCTVNKQKEIRWRRLQPHEGYLDRDYDFGYRQIPKIATTTTLSALREQRLSRSSNASSNHLLREPVHLWANAQSASLTDVKYRYLVVRDPVKRFVSAYQNKVVASRSLQKIAAGQRGKDQQSVVLDQQLETCPSLAHYVENFQAYSRIGVIRSHTRLLFELLEGLDLSFYSEVFPMEQLSKFWHRLGDHLGSPLTLEHRQKSGGGTNASLGRIDRDTFEKILSITAEDYQYLSAFYSVDKIVSEWEQAHRKNRQ